MKKWMKAGGDGNEICGTGEDGCNSCRVSKPDTVVNSGSRVRSVDYESLNQSSNQTLFANSTITQINEERNMAGYQNRQ